MQRQTLLAFYAAFALFAVSIPAQAQAPSAAPTSEVETHTLPPIETEKPVLEHPASAPAEAARVVTSDEHTGMMMAGTIFALALVAGVIGLFAARSEQH